MSEWMRRILESKRAMRQQLAAIPFAEKLKISAQLQARAQQLRAARRVQPGQDGNRSDTPEAR